MDSKSRSTMKAITWGILALLITITVSFAILGSWSVSIALAILSSPLETLLYYIRSRNDYGKETARAIKRTYKVK